MKSKFKIVGWTYEVWCYNVSIFALLINEWKLAAISPKMPSYDWRKVSLLNQLAKVNKYRLYIISKGRRTSNKSFFFSGRTIKRGAGKSPWTTKKKTHFFLSVKKNTKTSWTTKLYGGGTLTLVVRPLKTFLCASSLIEDRFPAN